jgi:hypothetical protein
MNVSYFHIYHWLISLTIYLFNQHEEKSHLIFNGNKFSFSTTNDTHCNSSQA